MKWQYSTFLKKYTDSLNRIWIDVFFWIWIRAVAESDPDQIWTFSYDKLNRDPKHCLCLAGKAGGQRNSNLRASLISMVILLPLVGDVSVSRLYWYRGVTVLLSGWVISSLGGWLVSALSIPIGENISNSSADFNPNHNHVNAASKQASLQITSCQHHHATPKQNYCVCWDHKE
jgi:hypothetical protein